MQDAGRPGNQYPNLRSYSLWGSHSSTRATTCSSAREFRSDALHKFGNELDVLWRDLQKLDTHPRRKGASRRHVRTATIPTSLKTVIETRQREPHQHLLVECLRLRRANEQAASADVTAIRREKLLDCPVATSTSASARGSSRCSSIGTLDLRSKPLDRSHANRGSERTQ